MEITTVATILSPPLQICTNALGALTHSNGTRIIPLVKFSMFLNIFSVMEEFDIPESPVFSDMSPPLIPSSVDEDDDFEDMEVFLTK
jgi:hypothetical protein